MFAVCKGNLQNCTKMGNIREIQKLRLKPTYSQQTKATNLLHMKATYVLSVSRGDLIGTLQMSTCLCQEASHSWYREAMYLSVSKGNARYLSGSKANWKISSMYLSVSERDMFAEY